MKKATCEAFVEADIGCRSRCLCPGHGIDVIETLAAVGEILFGRIEPVRGVSAQADDASQPNRPGKAYSCTDN